MAIKRDACSVLSLGMDTFLHEVPGKTDTPGVGRRQKNISPPLPVYCSNRIFSGASSMNTVWALTGLISAMQEAIVKSAFFMISLVE